MDTYYWESMDFRERRYRRPLGLFDGIENQEKNKGSPSEREERVRGSSKVSFGRVVLPDQFYGQGVGGREANPEATRISQQHTQSSLDWNVDTL